MSRTNAIAAKKIENREKLFPGLTAIEFWNRTSAKGFITIPRTLPIIGQIMDELCSGKPVSKVYFALWARCFDDYVVDIKGIEDELAFEAGFSNARAKNCVKERLTKLEELGFVRLNLTKTGIRHVAVLNPYRVCLSLYQNKKISDSLWASLNTRVTEIGSEDLMNKDDGIPF